MRSIQHSGREGTPVFKELIQWKNLKHIVSGVFIKCPMSSYVD